MSKATGGVEDNKRKRKGDRQKLKSPQIVSKTRSSPSSTKSDGSSEKEPGALDREGAVKSEQAASKTAAAVPSAEEVLRRQLNQGQRESVAESRYSSPNTLTAQPERYPKTDPSGGTVTATAGTASPPGKVKNNAAVSGAVSPTSAQADPESNNAALSAVVSPTSAQAEPASPFQTDRSTAPLSGASDPSLVADEHKKSQQLLRLSDLKRSRNGYEKPKARDLESISKPISAPSSTRLPVDMPRIACAACSIVVMVFVLASVVMFFRMVPKPSNRFCQTEGCIRHAQLLTADLDLSIDPCQNFSAYVCSSWFRRQSAVYIHYSMSAMDDVRKSWFPAFHNILRAGSRTLHAGLKPFRMYSTCIGEPSQYGSDVNKFREFQYSLRVPWPEAPEARRADALDVLMTLAFKWQVPIWLRIREPRPASALWRFVMDPGPFIPLMRQHHLGLGMDEYVRYWKSFYNHLSRGHDKPAFNQAAIEAIYSMEADVLSSLYAARMPPVLQPLMVPVGSMGKHTPPLRSEQWLHALKRIESDPEVTPKDLLLLSDGGFFRTLGQLFAKYNNTQLLELIAWSFVQLCAPAADYRLLVTRYGTDTATNKYRPYFCERFVESSYSLLVVALLSVTRVSEQQRAFVEAGFDSLVSAAAAMASTTPWMDQESRLLAAQKLALTRLRLWPPDKFLENGTLEELYKTFPNGGQSFAEYWVAASRSTAAQYHSLADADAFAYPVNYALPYHNYDGALAAVEVAVGAVTEPLYYTDGTNAMFYGGLGFLMALSLVKSLDSQGLKWHPNGSFGDSFLSRRSTAAFADRESCLEDSLAGGGGQQGDKGAAAGTTTRSVFPEIPALEVAYAAYRASIQQKDDSSQQLSAGQSGDQAFFMTLCYMTCSRERGVDCNKAVRNFAPFADAFHCARSTAMNPEKKCSFFGPH